MLFNNLNRYAANTNRLQKMLTNRYMNSKPDNDVESNSKHSWKDERCK